MKLVFDLANRAQKFAGLSISAREFLDLEGLSQFAGKTELFRGSLGWSRGLENKEGAIVFEEALKNMLQAMVNQDQEEIELWCDVLCKPVGEASARRAFERLRGNNAEALATCPYKEPIESEVP